MLFGSMLFMGPFLGMLAALVYGWLPSQTAYLGLALGLATLISIGACLRNVPWAIPWDTATGAARLPLPYGRDA